MLQEFRQELTSMVMEMAKTAAEPLTQPAPTEQQPNTASSSDILARVAQADVGARQSYLSLKHRLGRVD